MAISGRFSWAAILAGLFVVAGLSAQAQYRLERVIDGESIRVTGVGTVRLIGVDVSKRTDGLRPSNADTDVAARFLRALIAQPVRLEYDTIRTDSAKSVLAYVYLQDGTCLNAEIIRRGLARVNSGRPFARLVEFREYERQAQSARRGLWAQATATEAFQEPPPRDGNAPLPPSQLRIR